MLEAIQVRQLTKWYAGRPAVDHLNFSVGQGEVFALLGPNGAGKTTTIEILEGFRQPDSGEVGVLGLDPQRDGSQLKQRMGLMLQQPGVYPNIRPLELLTLLANFYPAPENPRALLDLVGLADTTRTPFKQLSGGQQRRLELAAALIGRPQLVFLDEPTAGMDPHARRLTWKLVRSFKKQGVTVLLTTHYIQEAEELADRVAILDHGRLLALDRPDALSRGASDEVRFTAPPGLDCQALLALPSAYFAAEERPGAYLMRTAWAPGLLAELTAWARDRGMVIKEMRVGRESLEEVFLRLTGSLPGNGEQP